MEKGSYYKQTLADRKRNIEKERKKKLLEKAKIKIKYAFYAYVHGSSSARYVVYRLSLFFSVFPASVRFHAVLGLLQTNCSGDEN